VFCGRIGNYENADPRNTGKSFRLLHGRIADRKFVQSKSLRIAESKFNRRANRNTGANVETNGAAIENNLVKPLVEEQAASVN
jgi:hypothetical protein